MTAPIETQACDPWAADLIDALKRAQAPAPAPHPASADAAVHDGRRSHRGRALDTRAGAKDPWSLPSRPRVHFIHDPDASPSAQTRLLRSCVDAGLMEVVLDHRKDISDMGLAACVDQCDVVVDQSKGSGSMYEALIARACHKPIVAAEWLQACLDGGHVVPLAPKYILPSGRERRPPTVATEGGAAGDAGATGDTTEGGAAGDRLLSSLDISLVQHCGGPAMSLVSFPLVTVRTMIRAFGGVKHVCDRDRRRLSVAVELAVPPSAPGAGPCSCPGHSAMRGGTAASPPGNAMDNEDSASLACADARLLDGVLGRRFDHVVNFRWLLDAMHAQRLPLLPPAPEHQVCGHRLLKYGACVLPLVDGRPRGRSG